MSEGNILDDSGITTRGRDLEEVFVTRREFRELRHEVEQMSENVNSFVASTLNYMKKMDVYQDNLIGALTNRTPAAHLPIDVHKQVVKGLIWAFSAVVVVAIGAVKLTPAALNALDKM